MTRLQRIWTDIVGVQDPPAITAIWLTAVVAVLIVMLRPTWRPARHAVTIAHEGGHALAALVTGRKLSGIRLHSDSSGLTLSRGKPRGLGMIVTAAAGYTAPSLLGLLAAGLLHQRHALAVLWTALLLLTAMLLKIRNFRGLYVMLVAGFVVFAVSWWASAPVQSLFAYLVTWFLLLAGPKTVLELQATRRRGRGSSSDADQLGRLTRVPGLFWVGFFLVFDLAALVVGAWLIVPRLVP